MQELPSDPREADAWRVKALRLEQQLSGLRRVRARVRGIAQALDTAMAARAEDRARAQAQALAIARGDAAAARRTLKDEVAELRLAHWRASNAASAERLALERAQAARVLELAELRRSFREALDDAGQRLADAQKAASGAQREIERSFEGLRTLEPLQAGLASHARPWPWLRAAGLAALAQADRLRAAGRYAEAAETYASAYAAFPQRWDLCVRAAEMLKRSGSLSSAEHCYRQALLLAPDDPAIFNGLGDLYAAWGRERAAGMAYEHARSVSKRADAEPDAVA